MQERRGFIFSSSLLTHEGVHRLLVGSLNGLDIGSETLKLYYFYGFVRNLCFIVYKQTIFTAKNTTVIRKESEVTSFSPILCLSVLPQ